MSQIQMVNLRDQYLNIKNEIDVGIQDVIDSCRFIKGPAVEQFESALSEYLDAKHVISCANGTDALQIALMSLGLESGDEVIVPSFTYVATAEVIALLGLKPVMVEVNEKTFNTTADLIEKAITSKTKAIIPVHLFGQCSDMQDIMELAEEKNLYVVEDNAQAIGSAYTYRDGQVKKTGTIGHIGCTSFFPSKNLGCYGDGGAIFTNDAELGRRIRMIANHGQSKKYYHSLIGVNSRLDAIQAAILNVKLKRLDEYQQKRQLTASVYDSAFNDLEYAEIPARQHNSTHVFHQYTLKVKNGLRDDLKKYLSEQGIPSMIYYPLPLYRQEAFKNFFGLGEIHESSERLCASVLSLPIHTEMTHEIQNVIIEGVHNFFDTISK